MSKDLSTFFKAAVEQRDMEALIGKIPYAKMIGIECLTIGTDFIFKLPQNENNLGNPTLPAIHGGVMGGFMETAAILYIMMGANSSQVPKVIDFSIDYLSPGRHCDTFARCELVRQGSKITNVRIYAYQTTESKPIATARAHFLLS